MEVCVCVARRSYNLFPSPAPGSSLAAFVESSFLANERDRMPSLLVNNPVDFWNEKVKSYFECDDVLENSIICYYENLVTEMDAFMDAIRPVCNVSSEIRIPMDSTKKEDKSFVEYKQEVLSYDPVRALGQDVYAKISGKINPDVLSRTIYS